MKKLLAVLAIIVLAGGLFCGCASPFSSATGAKIAAAALTAPVLASALDDVYAVLIAAKAVPDHQAEATKALASLDAIAQMVHVEGENLNGDKFNWASFVINAAIAAAKVMGYWL